MDTQKKFWKEIPEEPRYARSQTLVKWGVHVAASSLERIVTKNKTIIRGPEPRMTNTFMLPGKHNPNEIIESVKKGIYAANFSGGQVDITNGKFVFSCTEAYLIENGKITAPVKGATLIGNGPDALTRVKLIANDSKLDDGVGTCSKDGQSVPVGVGQPTMMLDSLTVGGTAV